MVGAVGLDPFGKTLVASLEERGVGVTSVLSKTGTSGMAIITVNEEGENYIVLSEGANGRLTEEDVATEVKWDGVYAVLLQNEIPWQTTEYVIQSANKAGVRVWLNPAPAREVPHDVLPLIDTLIVNETEAEVVSGEGGGRGYSGCSGSVDHRQRHLQRDHHPWRAGLLLWECQG